MLEYPIVGSRINPCSTHYRVFLLVRCLSWELQWKLGELYPIGTLKTATRARVWEGIKSQPPNNLLFFIPSYISNVTSIEGTFFQRFCCKREEKEVLDEQLEIWSFLLFLRVMAICISNTSSLGLSSHNVMGIHMDHINRITLLRLRSIHTIMVSPMTMESHTIRVRAKMTTPNSRLDIYFGGEGMTQLGMRIVGLTGGIASGKSTISNLFKANSIPVVDADVVARDVLRKGTGGWKRVVAAFGEDILQDNGEVDRARLGQIVFSDAAKRKLLNGLLAPFISSGISWEVARLWIKGSKVIVLDIPLLFEAKMDRFTKPIIVVWVDSETQLQRLMARDGISEEQALNRINAQTALDWKKTKADIVIDNSGSLEETKEQFQRVLVQITRPLNWRESVLSRSGAFWVLVSVILGVLVYRYIL